MKYYLGFYHDGEYHLINLNDEDYFLDKDCCDIINIIKYTATFACMDDLLEYFILNKLVDENIVKELSNNFKVEYLVEKGPKKAKDIAPLKIGKELFFSHSSEFFKIEFMKKYIYDNINNINFMEDLYATYLKKIGIVDDLKKVFLNNLDRPATNLMYLNSLGDIELDSFTQKNINNLKDILNAQIGKNIVHPLTEKGRTTVEGRLNSIMGNISSNNKQLIDTYRRLVSVLQKSYIYEIKLLNNLHHTIVIKDIQLSDDEIIKIISKIVDAICYSWDSKTKQYREDMNGKFRLQAHKYIFLANFLYNYDEYQKFIKKQTEMQISEEFEDGEEFLEAADFERMETSPEEQGLKLYYPRP